MPSLITALPNDTARSVKAGDVTTSTTRAPARRLFRLRCEAPEIHVRRRGEIGKDRPHCDRLVELLRVYLVERIVGGVVGVEIIKPVLAQRYHWCVRTMRCVTTAILPASDPGGAASSSA